jgi:DNA-binding NarL/FixJ family response regulator
VDDNPVVRRTVRAFLEWRHFPVCGEAANGEEAIQKVRQLKPNVVLLDVNMPGMNGIQTAAEILAKAPKIKIVFLSVHNTPGTLHATRMWAHGFVPKSAIATALIPALNHAAGITAKEV